MLETLEFIQRHWAIVVAIGGAVWTYFWLTMDSKYARKTDVSDLRKAIENNEKRRIKTSANFKRSGRFAFINDGNERQNRRIKYQHWQP